MKNNKFTLTCTACGTEQGGGYRPFCQSCQNMNDVAYDLSQVSLKASHNPFVRFFDLLPIQNSALLPEEGTYTPLIHARQLGASLDMPELYLKNETVLPTGSTKYRMAAVALAYLYENGVRHFCTSSTGNSSSAFAHLISHIPEMKMNLFTSSDFRARVNYHPSDQIEHYIVNQGSFVEAFQAAANFAQKNGLVSEQGFFNPGRREGLKLAFLEATEQIQQPIDWYVQAVSSAMGVYGAYKGAKELLELGEIQQLPHLLCIQQESCAPMVQAWQENSEHILERHLIAQPKGIASAILRGDPSRTYPTIRTIVKESGGFMASVSEAEIREARKQVLKLENIEICFAASAAVAGVIQAIRTTSIPRQARVVINLTGSDRPGHLIPEQVHYLDKIKGEWHF